MKLLIISRFKEVNGKWESLSKYEHRIEVFMPRPLEELSDQELEQFDIALKEIAESANCTPKAFPAMGDTPEKVRLTAAAYDKLREEIKTQMQEREQAFDKAAKDRLKELRNQA